jgi:cytochrome c biogenesis protein
MAADLRSIFGKSWRTIASIETGVVLLILVVILSAVGTIVLQRPVTRPEEMQSAYSPRVLEILDASGLTDVFHSWWFLGLVFLVSLSILAASIDRLPNRWRYFSRPYKFPDESFRRTLQPQKSLPLANKEGESGEESCLNAFERALESRGYHPERVVRQGQFGVFAERHPISELTVYVVHTGLLLIFFGVIGNGLWGWQGTLNLNVGQSSNDVRTADGKTRTLPFSIRCDAPGQEDSNSAKPRNWCSKLAAIKAGKNVEKMDILANEPLRTGGLRFSLSSYGTNGKIDRLLISASAKAGSTGKRYLSLALNDVVSLDEDATVRFAEFFPDFAVRDGQASSNSAGARNPAAHLILTSKSLGRDFDVWLPQPVQIANNPQASWQFQAIELKMGHFTNLDVSYAPGRWAVWSGIVMLALGLIAGFFLVHSRIWAVPVRDARTGAKMLWIGGSTNRDRNGFEARFNDLVSAIDNEQKLPTRAAVAMKPSISPKERTGAGQMSYK